MTVSRDNKCARARCERAPTAQLLRFLTCGGLGGRVPIGCTLPTFHTANCAASAQKNSKVGHGVCLAGFHAKWVPRKVRAGLRWGLPCVGAKQGGRWALDGIYLAGFSSKEEILNQELESVEKHGQDNDVDPYLQIDL